MNDLVSLIDRQENLISELFPFNSDEGRLLVLEGQIVHEFNLKTGDRIDFYDLTNYYYLGKEEKVQKKLFDTFISNHYL